MSGAADMTNGAGVDGGAGGAGGAVDPFGRRLEAAVASYGPLCAGIDPHPGLLTAWGLDDSVAGLETFSMRCVDAFAGHVAVVKPQSAFFERYGAAGLAVLERVLAGLREAGTLSLLDVKRGDIGTTMEGYARAYLAPEAPLRADAITASPYLGYESLRPALDLAARTGRGVFVLTLTSNPEGSQVQHAVRDGVSVAASVVAGVRADNERGAGRERHWGSIGMVVGATVGPAIADLGLDLAAANAPLLAPGLGAQGATAQDVRRSFGAAATRVLAASSRAVLAAGPSPITLRQKAIEVADGLREALHAGAGAGPVAPPPPPAAAGSAAGGQAAGRTSAAEPAAAEPAVMTELLAIRDSIDNIDAALVHLLAERFKCTQRVGRLKADHGLPPADPQRETAQIARLRSLAASAHLDPAFAEKFLAFVVDEVIRHHRAIAGDLREQRPS